MPIPAEAGQPAGGARVQAHGWGWRHSGRRAFAVSGLDLVIEPGERVLLLGASGSGKSTVLQGLAGVLGGDEDGEQSGELLIDGVPAARARGQVGLVLQDPDSQVVLARIGDDVAFGCENLGVPRAEIWRRVDQALRAVGLDLPLAHPTAALSGGQKQRLALAGALAMRPRLLLLDEPTANLDPAGVREVRDAVVRSLEDSDTTLIVVEHRVAVWKDAVTRVIVLDPDGGILADGPVDAVLGSAGARLAELGVWVPGALPEGPARNASAGSGSTRLTASRLSVARHAVQLAAEGIDLRVAAGETLTVSGVNGAGKSTLALTLAGLLPVHSGTLSADATLARGLTDAPARWKSRELLTRIGMVFQNPEHQFLAATVWGELAVGPRALRLPEQETKRRVDRILDRVGLAGLEHANPFTLSGGEKRRLSVATVLATGPDVLVLDEPTFGQDPNTWRELVALLAEQLDAGAAVVAVTHDSDFIEALADTRLELVRGADGVFSGTAIAEVAG